jgi:hypothetical protein
MIEIQDRLTVGLNADDSAVVQQWLAGLSDATRRELAILWDDRGDTCSRSVETLEHGRARWNTLPIVRGRFVRPGEVADDEEWRADHFEYLLDHPEIWIPEDPAGPRRSFHIGCTSHQGARAVLATGRIPADFACPLNEALCPLLIILRLASGRSFQLTGPPKT